MSQYELFDQEINNQISYNNMKDIHERIQSGMDSMSVLENYLYLTNESINDNIIEYLRDNGADIQDCPYALDYFCFNSNLNDIRSLEVLSNHCVQVRNDESCNNAMHAYVTSHQAYSFNFIQKLIKMGVNINHHGEDGKTPIMFSMYLDLSHSDYIEYRTSSYIDNMKMLIENGADLFAEDQYHRNIAHAVMYGLDLDKSWAFDLIEFLSKSGVDLNSSASDFEYPYPADYLFEGCSVANLRKLYYRRICMSPDRLMRMCANGFVTSKKANVSDSIKDVEYILRAFKAFLSAHDTISISDGTLMMLQYSRFFIIGEPLDGYSMDLHLLRTIMEKSSFSFEWLTFDNHRISNLDSVKNLFSKAAEAAHEKEMIEYLRMLKRQIQKGKDISFHNFNIDTDDVLIYDQQKDAMVRSDIDHVQNHDRIQLIRRNRYGDPIQSKIIELCGYLKHGNRYVLTEFDNKHADYLRNVYVCNVDLDEIQAG